MTYQRNYNNQQQNNQQQNYQEEEESVEELFLHDPPPDWEPTTEDVLRYAELIGIDAISDSEYLYLAKEGIMMPLPQTWGMYFDEQGTLIYINSQTEEILPHHPNAEDVKNHFEKLKKTKANRNKSNKENAMKKLIGRNLGTYFSMPYSSFVDFGFPPTNCIINSSTSRRC
jgi:hypothetical protein